MRVLWPKPSPAVLSPGLAAGVSEVSRFSCMEFLGVLWGLRLRRTEPGARSIAAVHVAFRTLQLRRRPDCIFSELNTQPTYSPVYASLCTSRYPTQNSGPSGSLILSRRDSSSPASYRFSPAHCNGDFSPTDHQTPYRPKLWIANILPVKGSTVICTVLLVPTTSALMSHCSPVNHHSASFSCSRIRLNVAC